MLENNKAFKTGRKFFEEKEKMKIAAIIPARFNSSRFQGKPLADICGKPMIWWVYQQMKKVKKISEVWVATDDMRWRGRDKCRLMKN